MILVIGGSGSGKSEYAEKLITEAAEKRGLQLYYLATMQVYDQEDKRKVEKHRRMRDGKGFTTIEQQRDIRCILDKTVNAAVLLECISNLAANEMFKENKNAAPEEAIEKILYDISELNKKCAALVIVSDDIFEDGIIYDEQTTAYINALGEINKGIAKEADKVFEVVAGIPVELK